jgi:hypothetical protein
MIMPDEDAVREEVLEGHHDELAQLLDRFDGRVQLTLKASYHEDVVVAEILASDAGLARLREAIQGRREDETRKERIALGERINAAIEMRRTRDCEEIMQRLRPLADAIALEPPEDELMVAHVGFLLPRDRIEELDATLEEIAQERAELMRFRLLGPMPPYSFIDVGDPAGGRRRASPTR